MTDLYVEETRPACQRRGTVIAIPGLTESAGCLQTTAQHWAERGFRVLAVDPRGHGLSPRWTKELLKRHPGDVIVEDILETVASMVTDESLVIYGHSAGGSAAAAVASELRSRTAAVVLEDPFWRLPITPHQDRAVAEEAADGLLAQQAMSDAERRAAITAAFPRWPADELPEWSLAKERMDVRLVHNGDVIPTRAWTTLLADLAEASVPVHIITGTVSIGNTADHRAIERSLGAEVTVIDGASHFVRRDERDVFHRLVDDVLDAAVPARRAAAAS